MKGSPSAWRRGTKQERAWKSGGLSGRSVGRLVGWLCAPIALIDQRLSASAHKFRVGRQRYGITQQGAQSSGPCDRGRRDSRSLFLSSFYACLVCRGLNPSCARGRLDHSSSHPISQRVKMSASARGQAPVLYSRWSVWQAGGREHAFAQMTPAVLVHITSIKD